MQPGFRFYPTEEELVSFYLHNELEEKRSDIHRVIPLLNVFQLEPWHLPKHCGELCHGDREQWFFFVPRQEREVRGGRPSRTTAEGYWKATGSPSYVYSSGNKVIGVKKSMVFYKGKAPNGRKTEWKMNEYRAIEEDLTTSVRRLRNEVSLCRIYVVSGSVRAFDRRPTHVITGASSSSATKVKEKDRVCSVSTNENATKSSLSEINKSDDDCILEMMSGLENLMEWDNTFTQD